MPPSHGLTGLVAIKPGAKKPIAVRAACGLSNAAPPMRQRGQTAATRRRPNRKGRIPEPDSSRCGAFALWDFMLALIFQEQIPGPKNASIARFDGLGCYQTRSEKAYRCPCGVRSFKRRAADAPARPDGGNEAAAKPQRSNPRARQQPLRRFCALGFHAGAHFSGANSRPEKRLHRTV